MRRYQHKLRGVLEPSILLLENGLLVKSLPLLTEKFGPVGASSNVRENSFECDTMLAYHFSGTLNVIM
jgi:hypothetical protein